MLLKEYQNYLRASVVNCFYSFTFWNDKKSQEFNLFI